ADPVWRRPGRWGRWSPRCWPPGTGCSPTRFTIWRFRVPPLWAFADRAPKPRVTGIVAGVVFLAGGLAWVWLLAPPAPGRVVAWLAAVAVAGAWLPGIANQVT